MKLKNYHKKNQLTPEFTIWAELSQKFRREKIQSSHDYFVDMLQEFNYLTDVQFVSLTLKETFYLIVILFLKLLTEFELITKVSSVELKKQIKKVLTILFKYFKIKSKIEII